MSKSFFYANLCDVGLDLAVIGEIRLSLIKKPFDIIMEGRRRSVCTFIAS
jgi:hypothetical protein